MTTQNYGTLPAGTVYQNPSGSQHCTACDHDFYSALEVEVLGLATRVKIPGLTDDMPAFMFEGYLYIGCQRIPIASAAVVLNALEEGVMLL